MCSGLASVYCLLDLRVGENSLVSGFGQCRQILGEDRRYRPHEAYNDADEALEKSHFNPLLRSVSEPTGLICRGLAPVGWDKKP